MNTLVLIKQVPDTGMNLRISNGALEESGLKWVLSPYDEFAVEEALKLRPLLGGKVFVMSLGPARSKEALLGALALGADEAFHLKTDQKIGDPFLLAQTLKNHIQSLPDLSFIFCGKLSADQNNFAVPQMLAQMMKWPFVTNINHLSYENNHLEITRECGGGIEEVLEGQAPLILSADKGLNQPRYPSLPGIMKAKKKPFHLIEVESVEEKISCLSVAPPTEKEPPKILEGEPDEQIKELVRLLKEKEKIL